MPIPPETRNLLLTVVGYSGELGTAIDSAKNDYATLLTGLRLAQADPGLTDSETVGFNHLLNYAKMVHAALDIDWWRVVIGGSNFTEMEFDDLTQYLAGQAYSIPVQETARLAMTAELVEAE